MTINFDEIRDKYKATFANKALDIQAAWDDKNIVQLHMLIHKLSGSSGGYVFDDICTLCQNTMKLNENNENIVSAQLEANIQQILVLLKQ